MESENKYFRIGCGVDRLPLKLSESRSGSIASQLSVMV